MSQCEPNAKQVRAMARILSWMFVGILTIFLTSCVDPKETENGVVYISSRGNNPIAQGISWSPLDENKVLTRAYETPLQPAELYLLDVQTHEKEYLVGPKKNAQLIDAKWMPDGKSALVLAVDTMGFEPSGWWAVNINDRSAKYILGPLDAIAWSPDGKIIAALREERGRGTAEKVELLLINIDTKVEEIIGTYEGMDDGRGISWSSDGQYLVFSLGQTRSSNLYILNTVTLQVKQITNNNGSQYPAWLPKGNIIAFEWYSPDNIAKTYLHLISMDGKCEVEIPNLENAWSPTWSPDGRRLGYISGDGIYFVDIYKIMGQDIYDGLCE